MFVVPISTQRYSHRRITKRRPIARQTPGSSSGTMVAASPSQNSAQTCSYCYVKAGSAACSVLRWCAKCQKRRYCSRDCQVADWKAGHKHWCGKSGELDFYFEVRVSPGKGLGVFALRAFERNEKIMAERPVVVFHNGGESMLRALESLRPSMRQAVEDLEPFQGPGINPGVASTSHLVRKVQRNCMSLGDEEGAGTGLFIVMSRVNHCCVGQASHWFAGSQCVKLLVAVKSISPGDEITMSYTKTVPYKQRQAKLKLAYGFQCSCPGCTDPELRSALDQDHEMDEALPRLMQHPSTLPKAIRLGKQLLAKREDLGLLEGCYRVCYDLFQALVMQRSTLKEAQFYVRKAAQVYEAFVGISDAQSKRYRALAADPSVHRNYLLLS